jgi:hypothetical protein
MIEVSRSRTVRSMILLHKIQQNTDRIARITMSVVVSRTFSRATLWEVIDRQWTVTDRHDKYRPRIDRLEMSRFAGLSRPR